MSKPKILLYDLETFPNKGYFWAGKMYEVNIIKTIEYGGLASVAWKFLGDSKIQFLSREGKRDDKNIVKKLWELFDQADATVAHNGIAFDMKTSNTNILKYSMNPPSPYKSIDTKVEMKKYFRFDSNSLDAASRFLNLGRKLKHEGFDMWEECMADQPSAWKKMEKYNKHDVYLLEQLYNKLLPWMKPAINVAQLSGLEFGCPKCGSENLVLNGMQLSPAGAYQRYRCKDCGGYCKARKVEKGSLKAKVVNL